MSRNERKQANLMTPAILAIRKSGHAFTLHEYQHDPAATSYGLEAAEVLQIDPSRVFKTLLVALDGDQRSLAVGIVPVTRQLDLKAMAKALGVKKAEMADPKQAERITGYVVGGISPIGQKKQLPTILDASASALDSLFVSAGRRGLEIELAPDALLAVCRAQAAGVAR